MLKSEEVIDMGRVGNCVRAPQSVSQSAKREGFGKDEGERCRQPFLCSGKGFGSNTGHQGVDSQDLQGEQDKEGVLALAGLGPVTKGSEGDV